MDHMKLSSEVILEVSMKREKRELCFPITAELQVVLDAIDSELHVPVELQKLIYKGKKFDHRDASRRLDEVLSVSPTDLGLPSVDTQSRPKKFSIVLIGSSEEEIAQILRFKEDPLLRGFEATALPSYMVPTVVRRTRQEYRGFDQVLAKRDPRFTDPSHEAAQNLLERLSADLGISRIMEKYKWKVQKLTEFLPTLEVGLVGITSGCLLGYNQNKGMEIGLRLRTDKPGGLLFYGEIRKTLIHELTHMVYSEHNADFWTLYSKLCKEADALDWTKSKGSTTKKSHADMTEGYVETGHLTTAWEGGKFVLGSSASEASEVAGSLQHSQSANDVRLQAAAAAEERLKMLQTESKENSSEAPFTMEESAISPSAESSFVADSGEAAVVGSSSVGKDSIDHEDSLGKPMEVATTEEASKAKDNEDRRKLEVRTEAEDLPLSSEEESAFSAFSTALQGMVARALDHSSGTHSLLRCLSLIRRCIVNIIDHPEESKYRRLRLQNEKLKASVFSVAGSLSLFRAMGFQETVAVIQEKTDDQLTLEKMSHTETPFLRRCVSAMEEAELLLQAALS